MSITAPGTDVEVVQPAQHVSSLTPVQIQAAALEAAGTKRSDIARIVNVSESTIKGWRGKEAYQQEVAKLSDANHEIILGTLRLLREELVDGARKAIEALIVNLEATDDKGEPKYRTRQEAAELLLKHGVAFLTEDGSKSDGPTQQTPVVINVGSSPPPVPTD